MNGYRGYQINHNELVNKDVLTLCQMQLDKIEAIVSDTRSKTLNFAKSDQEQEPRSSKRFHFTLQRPLVPFFLTDKKKCSTLLIEMFLSHHRSLIVPGVSPMSVPVTEEAIKQAVQTLFEKLATLRSLKTEDILLPGRQTSYERTIEETYAALVYVETALDALATELEYHHARIEHITFEVRGLY